MASLQQFNYLCSRCFFSVASDDCEYFVRDIDDRFKYRKKIYNLRKCGISIQFNKLSGWNFLQTFRPSEESTCTWYYLEPGSVKIILY